MTMILFSVIAYLLGSIPFGLLAGRLAKGIDIREHGSRNIGATNVFRTIGKKWGIVVLLLDAAKGAASCLFPLWTGIPELSVSIRLILGVAAILGHTFPVWLGFKGGKGVATSLGVFLAVCWQPTLSAFGIWILVFTVTRVISIASLAATLAFPLMVALFYWADPELLLLLPISLLLAGFIFYTHRSNIERLLQGTEKKLF
ncbi:MAG TPA: glycerol-3-phosphate 1-O-acyltransferase PlsY [Candidatus Omnitrophota bacterium]|jgi:glycerol-3-phosphate acyltransferase PlsY|nr:glycerol-3-phosphate 1-O-acyltransferase PlsY [Candidatus Omnitrophota bacterium]